MVIVPRVVGRPPRLRRRRLGRQARLRREQRLHALRGARFERGQLRRWAAAHVVRPRLVVRPRRALLADVEWLRQPRGDVDLRWALRHQPVLDLRLAVGGAVARDEVLDLLQEHDDLDDVALDDELPPLPRQLVLERILQDLPNDGPVVPLLGGRRPLVRDEGGGHVETRAAVVVQQANDVAAGEQRVDARVGQGEHAARAARRDVLRRHAADVAHPRERRRGDLHFVASREKKGLKKTERCCR
mmetsp:Transcript_127/g.468  ORF Transcript_127/g.468 Transcript_127/m.468 type:complete len:244 (-) Transcript_127:170-901(-)